MERRGFIRSIFGGAVAVSAPMEIFPGGHSGALKDVEVCYGACMTTEEMQNTDCESYQRLGYCIMQKGRNREKHIMDY